MLRSTGSRHAGFSSCGSQAKFLRGMWDLPGPGLEPVSPALAGGFLTTEPPGKPKDGDFCKTILSKVNEKGHLLVLFWVIFPELPRGGGMGGGTGGIQE